MNNSLVPKSNIDAWERKRLAAVLRKFNKNSANDEADLLSLRKRLVETKLGFAYDEILNLLRVELAVSSALAKLMNAVSLGKRKACITEIIVEGITATEVADGLEALMLESSPSHDMVNLSACPDHYVLRPLGKNRLEVIETTGGSPFPIQFFIDYGDEAGLTIPRDSSYPCQSVGVARLRDGTTIGGVRHQLRDQGNGFRARLAVEFPVMAPAYFIRQHQFHLACEFSHWFQWLLAHKSQ